MLAIQVDDPGPEARAFLAAHRATYPCALDPSLRVANRFGFTRAPYTVIVSKRGEIVARLDARTDEAIVWCDKVAAIPDAHPQIKSVASQIRAGAIKAGGKAPGGEAK